MSSIAQMARVMTDEPVTLPARRKSRLELTIERAEAVKQCERLRIAAYRKYLQQRGYVVMKAREYDAVANPHKPMGEGRV